MRALTALVIWIERVNETIGRAVAWLLLAMMGVQFALVVLRYVFGTGWLYASEAVVYMHAAVFLLASAYTLAVDAHVRVDVIYRGLSAKARAGVDLLGTVVFLLPFCWLLWQQGYPYVARSWAVLEGSRETSGLPFVYLLKTLILVFAATVALQGVAWLIRAGLVVLDKPLPPRPEAVAEADSGQL